MYRHIETGTIFYSFDQMRLWLVQNKDTAIVESQIQQLLDEMVIENYSSPPSSPTDFTESNYQALWQAAHDYEFAQISGSALSLLTIGVMQGKPKSLAIKSWIQDIWNLYYTRKATITNTQIPNVMLDFSSCGEIPYTVPELMLEVSV